MAADVLSPKVAKSSIAVVSPLLDNGHLVTYEEYVSLLCHLGVKKVYKMQLS